MAGFIGTLWREIIWITAPTKFVDYWSLFYSLPSAVGLLILRYILSRFVFSPFGIYLGVKVTECRQPPPNPVLENAYSESRQQVLGVSKRVDMTEREVETWFNLRRRLDRPSVLTKFCECSWQCLYYTSLFIFGLVVLWDKPWFWDISQCWTEYPSSLNMTNDVWCYYMISLCFYWSLFIGQFCIDVKRHDFWQMFVHHIVTIFLISFSYLTGMYKIGTLVIVVHDCGDIFLQAAKMAKYANYHTLCNVLFGIFTVVWIITRMGVYPLWILRSALRACDKLEPHFRACYTFNGLLVLLFGLHCFWTFLILKIAVGALGDGRVERDVRSSGDETSDND